MQISLFVLRDNLTRSKRADVLDEIAEKMSHEVGGNPRDAIITLISAACNMARRNNPEMTSSALIDALTDIVARAEAATPHQPRDADPTNILKRIVGHLPDAKPVKSNSA